MIAIAHFSLGIAGALFLLIYFPAFVSKYIGNLVKYDLFFVLGCGFFAMLPDLGKVIASKTIEAFHASPLCNICFGHHFIDTFPDTAAAAAIPILIAVFFAWKYFGGLK